MRKTWCAEEINNQQTCLQENQLRLHAFQRKSIKNMRFEDMEWWGIFPPMCDHQCRDTAKRYAWAQVTLVVL
jgi:hypothetical protein